MLVPLFWMLPLVISAPHPHDSFPIKDGQRVVFLGDSNMYAGMMVQYFEAFVYARFPERKIDVINLGLPSETVSGLSEPDHPYPRPWLFERLDRALAKTKPDWVIACYGINDGIYYPYSEERFVAYKKGIHRLVDRVKASGAHLILLTPWPFDAGAIQKEVLPASAPKFSWTHPYEAYEDVMKTYSRWLISEKLGVKVIDGRTAAQRALEANRRAQPDFKFASDGVHLDRNGQWIIGARLLEELGMDHLYVARFTGTLMSPRATEFLQLVQQRNRMLCDAWLTDVGHKRPDMPVGKPLSGAILEAAALEKRIRELAQPVTLELRLVPAP